MFYTLVYADNDYNGKQVENTKEIKENWDLYNEGQ